MQILVADDDGVSRQMLSIFLTRLGYDVLAVNDGDAAWATLQTKDAPDLAILDWIMPGHDGIDVCKLARANAATARKYLILLTAKSEKDDIVTGLNAGANDYVTKPFDEKELLARVRVGERMIQLENQLQNRVHELEHAMAHIKRLQGILPICMFCHRIRDDEESWQRIEQYIMENSDAQISHGLCPDCFEKHYPDLYEKSLESEDT